MISPLELAAQGMKEAVLTIHQDANNKGRILFSIDLSLDDTTNPDDVVTIPTCDLVALTLFNIARLQPEAFNNTFIKVQDCVIAIAEAQNAGASPEQIAEIREAHGVQFRAA